MIIYKQRPPKEEDKRRDTHLWFAWYPVLTGGPQYRYRDLVWLETVHRQIITKEGMKLYRRVSPEDLLKIQAALKA